MSLSLDALFLSNGLILSCERTGGGRYGSYFGGSMIGCVRGEGTGFLSKEETLVPDGTPLAPGITAPLLALLNGLG